MVTDISIYEGVMKVLCTGRKELLKDHSQQVLPINILGF
uniref:Uncharacterized protein n=1 Tax=Anguilla anguilla TaxID=7936 RepID=A0A0E9PPK0_ANGAN